MLSRCTHCLRPLARTAPKRATTSFRHLSFLTSSSSSSPSLVPRLRPNPPLQPSLRSSKRLISIPAQPPPNPSEDFEPLEPEDGGVAASMSLTPSAISQIEKAQQLKKDLNLALRLMVESGGCHGYQYKMAVTSIREQDDYLFEPENTTAKLLVDSASLPLVKGSTIDYATELIGSSFRVVENPQSKDAGCGCGVSWELKDL
ncbi:hypothetical protein JCM3765_001195 [Sporobolomyces pararoseus]